MILKLTVDYENHCRELVPNKEFDEFKEKFLSGLFNWKAFGVLDNSEKLIGIVTTYSIKDTAEWFLLKHYSNFNDHLSTLLDHVCKNFEERELYKFSWMSNDCEMDFLYNFIPKRYDNYLIYTLRVNAHSEYQKYYQLYYNEDSIECDSKIYCSILSDKKLS
jgi:hypothetical protein